MVQFSYQTVRQLIRTLFIAPFKKVVRMEWGWFVVLIFCKKVKYFWPFLLKVLRIQVKLSMMYTPSSLERLTLSMDF